MAAGLTARENEVMRLASLGQTNKAIAYALKLSEQTVKNHFYNAYRKLGVKNRAHAVAIYSMGGSWIGRMRRVIAAMFLVMVLVALTIPVVAASTVQIPASGWDYLGGEDSPATWSRLGQRVVIDDGEIYCLGYRLCKVGNPTGNVTLSVRDSATDAVLWLQVWGDASELPDANNNTYSRVFCDADYLVRVDGDIRICVEYYGGNETDYVQAGYYSGDKITGQWYTNYVNYATDAGGWHDIGEAEEAAYYMSYVAKDTEPDNGDDNTASGGISTALWVVIIALPVTGGLGIWYLKARRQAS